MGEKKKRSRTNAPNLARFIPPGRPCFGTVYLSGEMHACRKYAIHDFLGFVCSWAVCHSRQFSVPFQQSLVVRLHLHFRTFTRSQTNFLLRHHLSQSPILSSPVAIKRAMSTAAAAAEEGNSDMFGPTQEQQQVFSFFFFFFFCF